MVMNKIIIDEICVVYKDDFNGDIDYIVKVIKNNYELFKYNLDDSNIICLFDTSIKGVVSCSDFDEYFNNIIFNYYLTDKNIELVFTDDYIINAYKLYLFIEYNSSNDIDVKREDLLKCMAIRYYIENDDIESLINYLKELSESNTNDIIDWYKNNTRYSIYNILINEELSSFSEDNQQLEKELKTIFNFVLSFSSDTLYSCFDDLNIDDDRLYVDEDLRNILFIGYLNYINAPKDWYEKYNDLVTNGNIKIGDRSSCCNGIITLELNNTLDDVVILAHEFAHYMSKDFIYPTDSSLLEFCSIYHELNIQNFLVKKGYDIEDATSFSKYRFNKEISNFFGLVPILKDIVRVIQEEGLNREDLRKEKLESVRRVDRIYKDDPRNIVLSDEEIYNILDQEIDNRIISIIKEPDFVVVVFQYILDYLLARKVIDKDVDIDLINYITVHLSEYKDIDEILKLFDIDDFYMNGVQKVKK